MQSHIFICAICLAVHFSFSVCGAVPARTHASIIGALDAKAITRGKAIFERDCQICHGTKETVGALPNSLRFAEGTFKNGNDPQSMYHTIRDGFGLYMPPNPGLTHQQVYDVAHYIREVFVKPHNPKQYFAINEAYLQNLDAAALGKETNREPHYKLAPRWRQTLLRRHADSALRHDRDT